MDTTFLWATGIEDTFIPQARPGLRALDEVSQARLRRNFADLDALRQDQILASVQRGIARGESWSGISPQRFLEELLHEATELYHTAPVTEEAV